MFGVMDHLAVTICESPDEAVAKGFVYAAGEYTAVEIKQVVVVRKGTQESKSSVDLVLADNLGNKYVVMVTGALLKSIPCGD